MPQGLCIGIHSTTGRAWRLGGGPTNSWNGSSLRAAAFIRCRVSACCASHDHKYTSQRSKLRSGCGSSRADTLPSASLSYSARHRRRSLLSSEPHIHAVLSSMLLKRHLRNPATNLRQPTHGLNMVRDDSRALVGQLVHQHAEPSNARLLLRIRLDHPAINKNLVAVEELLSCPTNNTAT